MSWQKVLYPMIYLVLVALFLVGCGAPADTPTAVVPSTDTAEEPPATATPVPEPTAVVPSTDTPEEPPDTATPVPEPSVAASVEPGEAGCDANSPPIADAGGPYQAMMGKGHAFVTLDGSKSSDADGTIETYEWDFGDNSEPGSGQSVMHPYGSIGTFEAELTVTDNCGAVGQDTAEVTIVGPTPPTTEPPVSSTSAPSTDEPAPSTSAPSTDEPAPPTSAPSTDEPVPATDPDLIILSFAVNNPEWYSIIGPTFKASGTVVVKNVGDSPALGFEVGIVGVNREDKYVQFSFFLDDPALTAELASGQEATLTGQIELAHHGHFDVSCLDEDYDATYCAMRDENTLWLMAIADYCEGVGVSHCAVEEIDEANNVWGPVVLEKPE